MSSWVFYFAAALNSIAILPCLFMLGMAAFYMMIGKPEVGRVLVLIFKHQGSVIGIPKMEYVYPACVLLPELAFMLVMTWIDNRTVQISVTMCTMWYLVCAVTVAVDKIFVLKKSIMDSHATYHFDLLVLVGLILRLAMPSDFGIASCEKLFAVWAAAVCSLGFIFCSAIYVREPEQQHCSKMLSAICDAFDKLAADKNEKGPIFPAESKYPKGFSPAPDLELLSQKEQGDVKYAWLPFVLLAVFTFFAGGGIGAWTVNEEGDMTGTAGLPGVMSLLGIGVVFAALGGLSLQLRDLIMIPLNSVIPSAPSSSRSGSPRAQSPSAGAAGALAI